MACAGGLACWLRIRALPCEKIPSCPTDWSILFLQARDALGLTQKQLGALLGMDRRTIQRWEERGGIGMDRKQAEILAAALRPSHAALADTVLKAVRLEEVRGGRLASPEAVASILEAAAHAGGMSVEAVKPIVRAALTATAAAGTHPSAVVAAMSEGT